GQPFIEESRTNFKAPSTMTKAQAGADLKLSAEEIKFTSAGDMTARWQREMADLNAPEVADLAWRKTALDGTKGRVLSIAWRLQNGAHGLHINGPDSERETLQSFVDQLSAALSTHGTGRPPFFIGHNVTF